MSIDYFQLNDEEYWTSPLKTFSDVGRELRNKKEEGIYIGAPSYVSIDKRDKLPIVALRLDESQVVSNTIFDEHAVVTVLDMSRSIGYAAKAVESKFKKPKRDPNAPPPPPGYRFDGGAIDVRNRLNIPWEPGEYLIRVIIRDKISNRIIVKVGPDKFKDKINDLNNILMEIKKENTPVEIWPQRSNPFPNYDNIETSPEIKEIGIKLKINPEHKTGTNEPVLLSGSYILPKTSAYSIKESDKENNESLPDAIVPFSLLLTGSKVAEPFIWNIKIPVNYKESVDDNTLIKGYFNLDLNQLGNLGNIEQTYYIYAFSEEYMAGPYKIEIINKTK